jgi:serine/threonine protein kinase
MGGGCTSPQSSLSLSLSLTHSLSLSLSPDGLTYGPQVLKKDHVFDKKQVEHTISERNILRDINHPFVVRLRFAFQNQNKLYLVMDYFAGGSLFYHLRRRKRLGESLAKFYAAELALALAHLHRMNVIYRDLKLENILMDAKGHVALTDFGLSKDNVMNGEGTSTFCGTAEYIAPELLERKMYGFGVDWWSFGCLVYEMVHGQTPFYDKNRKIMFKKILYMDPIYPVGFSIYAQRYVHFAAVSNVRFDISLFPGP